MKGITQASYRGRVHFLEEEIRRFRHTPGMEGAVSRYAEGIGNLCAQFEPQHAEDWFRMSLTWLDKVFQHPTIRSAFLHWKLDDHATFQSHCADVSHQTITKLEDDAWLASALRHQVAREKQNLALATFLVGDYAKAERLTAQFIEQGAEPNGPHLIHAIHQLARGAQASDSDSFDAGLAILRDNIKEWPTSESTELIDLYRYALWLRGTIVRS